MSIQQLRCLDLSAPWGLPLGRSLQATLLGPASPGHSLLLGMGQKLLAGGPPNGGLPTDFVSLSLSCPRLFSCLLLPPPALTCPPNSRYRLCAQRCPATCFPSFLGMSCKNRCVEGCECNPGFVLSGLQCIPQSQCGCLEPTVGYFKVSLWHWVAPLCRLPFWSLGESGCGTEGREATPCRQLGGGMFGARSASPFLSPALQGSPSNFSLRCLPAGLRPLALSSPCPGVVFPEFLIL